MERDAPERSPELAGVIRRALDARLIEVRGSTPARIERVYTDGSGNITAVDCKPLIMDAYLDEADERQVDSLPVIPRVPVMFPAGGGFRLTLPVAVGDFCKLTFSAASLDKWLTGKGAEVDPEVDESHGGLHNAIAELGLRPFGAPLASVPSDHATIGYDGPDDGTHVKLHLRADMLIAGPEAGAQLVALSNLVASTLGRLQAVLNAFFSATATPVNEPGNGAPSALQIALKAALSAAHITDVLSGDATWPDSVAAQRLMAK